MANSDSFDSDQRGRAAIGRDGGQDTQGAWQGSYQVTIRPTGRCAPDVVRDGRQLNASARRNRGGEVISRGQADENDIELDQDD